jgi:glycogen operon protein
LIESGNPDVLGATATKDGVNFAVWSSTADTIDLCLFDGQGRETAILPLPATDRHVHHGFVPGLKPGQLYGFRVRGTWAPAAGLRHNHAKLLIDPYARQLAGEFRWDYAVFDYASMEDADEANTRDSAPFMPKCVVSEPVERLDGRPSIPWSESIFYETNVRGFTMRHPALDGPNRGKFSGMRHAAVIGHLKALGVTSIELMPVQAWIDEHHLARIGLRNFWGYNSIAFMAPMQRLAGEQPVAEFRDMVRTLHDAGLEVILDIVFNHTGESNGFGPALSFKGLDNLAYYRTVPGDPSAYINDTGTGNTINADQPVVQRLVLDSLKYWSGEMGADGFRFDLAPVLGRHPDGFSSSHPLLEAIVSEPALAGVKMIAEPWDPGPGGYQLGRFPGRWAEWNDRFRDGTRRFWRGDAGQSGEFARRLHGSADLFDNGQRSPSASINFVTAHDGFTLLDTVSYLERHNEANGEENRDGHAHNCSTNHGVEGPTDDDAINRRRRQHRLNLLATLLFSQGSPMLLAGDEFGNSQSGNNNAYAQDNEIGWLDWHGLDRDPEFFAQVRQLISLRRELALLRVDEYIHNGLDSDSGRITIDWLGVDGDPMQDHEWTEGRSKLVLLEREQSREDREKLAIVVNGAAETLRFRLPDAVGRHWSMRFTSTTSGNALHTTSFDAEPMSIALLTSRTESEP